MNETEQLGAENSLRSVRLHFIIIESSRFCKALVVVCKCEDRTEPLPYIPQLHIFCSANITVTNFNVRL